MKTLTVDEHQQFALILGLGLRMEALKGWMRVESEAYRATVKPEQFVQTIQTKCAELEGIARMLETLDPKGTGHHIARAIAAAHTDLLEGKL